MLGAGLSFGKNIFDYVFERKSAGGQVGDQSEFVNGMSRVMAEVGARLGSGLSELHFRYFCDKLAAAFCPCYFAYIFRQVGISRCLMLLDNSFRRGNLPLITRLIGQFKVVCCQVALSEWGLSGSDAMCVKLSSQRHARCTGAVDCTLPTLAYASPSNPRSFIGTRQLVSGHVFLQKQQVSCCPAVKQLYPHPQGLMSSGGGGGGQQGKYYCLTATVEVLSAFKQHS